MKMSNFKKIALILIAVAIVAAAWMTVQRCCQGMKYHDLFGRLDNASVVLYRQIGGHTQVILDPNSPKEERFDLPNTFFSKDTLEKYYLLKRVEVREDGWQVWKRRTVDVMIVCVL